MMQMPPRIGLVIVEKIGYVTTGLVRIDIVIGYVCHSTIGIGVAIYEDIRRYQVLANNYRMLELMKSLNFQISNDPSDPGIKLAVQRLNY